MTIRETKSTDFCLSLNKTKHKDKHEVFRILDDLTKIKQHNIKQDYGGGAEIAQKESKTFLKQGN